MTHSWLRAKPTSVTSGGTRGVSTRISMNGATRTPFLQEKPPHVNYPPNPEGAVSRAIRAASYRRSIIAAQKRPFLVDPKATIR